MSGILGHRLDAESAAASMAGWIRTHGLPMALGRREWMAAFRGHEIRVVVRGPLRARLYIDGECLDKRSPLLATSRQVPLLSAQLPSRRFGLEIVEVFASPLLARRIEIRAGGKWVECTRPPG